MFNYNNTQFLFLFLFQLIILAVTSSIVYLNKKNKNLTNSINFKKKIHKIVIFLFIWTLSGLPINSLFLIKLNIININIYSLLMLSIIFTIINTLFLLIYLSFYNNNFFLNKKIKYNLNYKNIIYLFVMLNILVLHCYIIIYLF